MTGTIFNHSDVGMLPLRLAPTSVEWSFNLVSRTTPSYAGEVVQVLAVNFDRLVIEGQFGKEGMHGANLGGGKLTPRPTSELRDFNTGGKYGIGLTQMTEFFQRYFAIASQGHDAQVEGHFTETPMTLRYEGSSDVGVELGRDEAWQVYPVSFPSYSIALENFAPVWRVECEVFEAPASVKAVTQKDIITQLSGTDDNALRPGVGYRPFNPFSDPFALANPDAKNFANLSAAQQSAMLQLAQKEANSNADKVYETWRSFLPAYDDATLTKLVGIGGSLPISDPTTTPTITQGNHGGSGG